MSEPAWSNTDPELELEQVPDPAPSSSSASDGDDPDTLTCPECLKPFTGGFKHAALARHRKKDHNVLPAGRQRKERAPRRAAAASSSSSSSTDRRRRNIKESLLELVDTSDMLRGRQVSHEPADLADILRRDADRIAVALAGLAGKVSPLGFVVDRLLGTGGPFSLIRAFGPTIRKLRQIALERSAAAQAAEVPLYASGEPLIADEQARMIEHGRLHDSTVVPLPPYGAE